MVKRMMPARELRVIKVVRKKRAASGRLSDTSEDCKKAIWRIGQPCDWQTSK
ncbi:Hypothetical predicted protein, partial [Pelobates cultripes]